MNNVSVVHSIRIIKPKPVVYGDKLISKTLRQQNVQTHQLNPDKSTGSVWGETCALKFFLFSTTAQQMLLLCQGINGSREDGPAPPSWSHKRSYPGEHVRKQITHQSTFQSEYED